MNTPDEVIATDACLTGIGGISGKQYFHKELLEKILKIPELHITHFEMKGMDSTTVMGKEMERHQIQNILQQ